MPKYELHELAKITDDPLRLTANSRSCNWVLKHFVVTENSEFMHKLG